MGLSPANALELEVFSVLVPRFGEIHAERLVSGPGLLLLYLTLAEIRGEAPGAHSPAQVSTLALQGEDSLAVRRYRPFARCWAPPVAISYWPTEPMAGCTWPGALCRNYRAFSAPVRFHRPFSREGCNGRTPGSGSPVCHHCGTARPDRCRACANCLELQKACQVHVGHSRHGHGDASDRVIKKAQNSQNSCVGYSGRTPVWCYTHLAEKFQRYLCSRRSSIKFLGTFTINNY